MQSLKILFAGLDNAGKSSILNALEEKYSTLTKMTPTKGPDRREFNLFGFTISNWDLGGQKGYRDLYLQEKNRFFTQVNTLFYVIDVQDTTRDDEVFNYLKTILDTIRELNEKPGIVICFHKVDKDIETDPRFQERLQALEQRLNAIAGDFKIKLFKTTIFEKWTLLKAFSQGVVAMSPKTILLESQLKEFARRTFSSAVMLVDSNLLTMGVHASRSEFIQICEAVVPHAAQASEKLMRYDINTDNIVVSVKPGSYYEEFKGKDMVLMFVPLAVGKYMFSIISLTRNPKTLKLMLKNSEWLADNLIDIISSFYF
nr:ADP-ribosylation factor-like protein [Candidatus Sigynarchaeota archaeon]